MLSVQLPMDILNGWNVLVVDDEPDSLEVATLLLEMYGANVMSGVNGIEGIEKAAHQRPDFIISDLSMPKMSGWEMLEKLKSERSTLDIPVIALTAHAMDGDRNRAIAAGFHNYLTKPLQPETFVTDLLSLLIDIPHMAAQLNEKIAKEMAK